MRQITAYLTFGGMLALSACTRPVPPVQAPVSEVTSTVAKEPSLPSQGVEVTVPEQVSVVQVEEEVEEEVEVTVRDLCEPEDSRRAWPTDEERKEARKVINDTCQAMGVSQESCAYFRIVSVRESSYRWWVRHKKKGDTAAAMNGYLAAARAYGWVARWSRPARRAEDLSQLELYPVSDEPNPYFPEVERWLTGGLGLGGLNVGYHLRKIDTSAPPEILCDPVLNVMVQVTIARRAVRRYKAKNWIEVQAVYAGRTAYNEEGQMRPASDPQKDRAIKSRCKKWGLDCYAKPQLGKKIDLDRMTAEEIYEAAEAIRGKPLPPFGESDWDSSPAQIHEG